MSARLPPHNIVYPVLAVFRENKLSPDLWDTWSILRGISWVNKYEFSPPVSLVELLELHRGSIATTRALIDRLQKLESRGWLKMLSEPGKRNVYVPCVPPDRPAAVCAEGASIAGEEPADFPRSDETAHAGHEKAIPPTSEVDFTSPISTVVAVGTDLPDPDRNVPTTATSTTRASPRTKEERNRILDALCDLGIESDEAFAEILGDEPVEFRGRPWDGSHVTAEYVENWVAHYRREGKRAKLGGGYYRTQIREKRMSPYEMTPRARAEYRAQKDEEWKHDQLVTAR